jgi:hypothetical protein
MSSATATPKGSGGYDTISSFVGATRSLARQTANVLAGGTFASTLSNAALEAAMSAGSSSTAGSDLDNQMQPITYFLWAKMPFASDGQNLIKGSVLFFNAPGEDLIDMKPLAFTLPSLNYALERTAREQAAHKQASLALSYATSNDGSAAAKRQRLARLGPNVNGLHAEILQDRIFVTELDRLYVPDTDPDAPGQISTAEQQVFSQKFHYGGFVQHIEEQTLQMQKLLTTAIAKHLEIPNLWGVVRQGQVLGFCAKWITRPRYDVFYDENGRVAGKTTNVPFIQVVPQSCERRMPRHCTGSAANNFEPTDDDLDAIVMREVKQRLNKVDPETGLILCDKYEKDVEFSIAYPAWTFGLWFPVGTVTKTRVSTTEASTRMATRNPTSYISLQGSHRIDVQLAQI